MKNDDFSEVPIITVYVVWYKQFLNFNWIIPKERSWNFKNNSEIHRLTRKLWHHIVTCTYTVSYVCNVQWNYRTNISLKDIKQFKAKKSSVEPTQTMWGRYITHWRCTAQHALIFHSFQHIWRGQRHLLTAPLFPQISHHAERHWIRNLWR